jgi:PAS domain S-box-containing protein
MSVLTESAIANSDKADGTPRLPDASAELELELHRYAEIVATTTDLMSLRDHQGRFVLVNDQYCRYFNLAREQIIGHHASELFGADQYRQLIGPCSERSLRGEIVRTESWVDYPGAGRRYMELQYHPFREPGGAIAGVVVSARDLTEHKQAEMDLHARLAQQAALARFGSLALVERDPEVIARRAVELCAQVLDTGLCQFLEVIPEADRLLFSAGVGWRDGLVGTAMQETGEEAQAVYSLLTRSPIIIADLEDESRFRPSPYLLEHDVTSGVSLLVGDPENPLGTLGVFSTARRRFSLEDASFLESIANTLAGAILRGRTERELRAGEERFRLTAQTSSDLIFEWHIDSGAIRWIGETPASFDYHVSDLPPTIDQWLQAIHPDDVQNISDAVRTTLASPAAVFDQEYRIRIGEHGWRVWEARGAAVDSGAAPASRWIGSCSDVTDARQLKERLVQSQKMDALGQLTGGVAHDFNNRLTVILGNLELLDRRLADRDAKRLVQSALAAAEGGAELTRQLLAFSRKQVLENTVFDVNELLNESHDLLTRTLGETITVSTVCAADRCQINSDRTQLENIILNLAVNARHAMPSGGRLTIETEVVTHDASYVASHSDTRAGNYVMIAVSDTGAGMNEEVKRHAFEPFFTTKPQGQGTGLGLAMVFGFVTQSGGHVELYSEEGHGTCVKIYLPRWHAEAGADTGAGSASDDDGRSLLGRTVLLVEDESQVREVAVEILRSMECELLVASNAAEAMKLFDQHPAIDLLFTDVVMPGNMSGADLAVALRARRPDLRVLYTSGYAPHAVNGRYAINGDHDRWIAKPYRPAALCKAVRDALLNRS